MMPATVPTIMLDRLEAKGRAVMNDLKAMREMVA